MSRLTLLRLLALVALLLSSALLVDYFQPTPEVCGFSGCTQVLASHFGRILGAPLPIFGIATFVTLIVLSLFPERKIGFWLRPFGAVAGLGGFALILVQLFVIGAVCPYCLAIDVAAVLMGILANLGGTSRSVSPLSPSVRYGWLAGVMFSTGLGASWGMFQLPVEAPEEIKAHWVPGKINVIEVADFECPHCRKSHVLLKQVLAEEGEKIHFVQLTAPMPKHRNARDASKAYLCGQKQGMGSEMAEALYQAADLSRPALVKLADALGLDVPSFKSCVADPDLDKHLDAQVKWVELASPKGLPVIWIQEDRLNSLTWETLRAALKRAEERLARKH